MTPTLTPEELEWLTYNWTPGNAAFRAWLAGSDKAQELLSRLIYVEMRKLEVQHEEIFA